VICNLQKTPRDGKADVIIHTYVDEVMRGLMQGLGLAFPLYRAVCRFHVVLDHGDTLAGIVCERRHPCPPIYRICTICRTLCSMEEWPSKQWQSFSNNIARHHSCPQRADQTSPWHQPTIRPYERRLVPGPSQCGSGRRCAEHLPYR
jgi:hypothetical protein